MALCPNCNKELQDGAQFCDGCGAQLQQENVFCPNCGKQLEAGAAFCDGCGNALNESEAIEPVAQAEVAEQPCDCCDTTEQKFVPQVAVSSIIKAVLNLPKKVIGLAAAAVALVLVLVIVLSTVFTPKASNHILYLKDSQISYTAVSRIKPFEVTENLADDVSDASLVSARWALGNATHVTADGKLIFFMDEIEDGNYEFYYRYLKNEKKEAEKIDSNVKSYFVSDSGKKVFYLTTDGKLYQYDLNDKDKIDSDVAGFGASVDGKKLWYRNDKGDIYYKNGNKDEEKLESKTDYMCYVSEDFKTFYYVKKDNLYMHKVGKDKVKIAGDVDDVIAIYDSGEIYYVKDAEKKEVNLADYVEDDMADFDASLEEPEYPSFSDFYDSYDDYDEARDAYNEAYEKYKEDRDIWWEKENRDDLREDLKEETVEVETATLCYYNGKKTIELTDNYSSYNTYASENPVLIFSTLDKNAGSKVKISEVDSYWDVKDMVEESLDESGKKNLAVKDKISELDIDEASSFDISADGKTVYFMKDIERSDDGEGEPHGDLYKMAISGNKAKKAEKYDTDVYAYSSYFITNGSYVYYKDYEDNQGELYINKKKIDSDVYSVSQVNNTDKFVYVTDYDSEDKCGTLNILDGKKTKKIADDVFDWDVTANGEIVYLADYDTDDYEGEMFLYKGGKSKKIDDEVMAILSTSSSNYHYVYLDD